MNRKELVDALNDLTSIYKKDSRLCFNNDELTLYNNFVPVAKIPFNTGISCGIELELFHNVLKRLNTDEVDLLLEGDTLVLKSKRSKTKFPSIPKEEFPKFEISDDWKDFDVDWDMLELSVDCCHGDDSRSFIRTVNFVDNTVVATDGKVLMQFACPLDESFHIMPEETKTLCKVRPSKYYSDDVGLFFKTSNGLCFHVSKVKCSEIPQYKRVLTMDAKEINLPTDLEEIIGRIGLFDRTGETAPVNIKIEKNFVLLKIDGGKGTHVEREACENEHEMSVYFGINILRKLAKINGKHTINDSQIMVSNDSCVFTAMAMRSRG